MEVLKLETQDACDVGQASTRLRSSRAGQNKVHDKRCGFSTTPCKLEHVINTFMIEHCTPHRQVMVTRII